MPRMVWKPVPATACEWSSATVIRVFFFAKISIYPCTFGQFQLVLFGYSFALCLSSLSLFSFSSFYHRMIWICARETGVGVSVLA